MSYEKLELHYFFSDSSHDISTVVRNDCEKDLLNIFLELAKILDFEIELNSEAELEGGFREIWNFMGKNSAQITLIIAAITILLSRVPPENSELTKLQIENLKLDNELKRRELKKLEKTTLSSKQIESITTKVIDSVISNYKLLWYKSRFYKRLDDYSKVNRIEFGAVNEKYEPISEIKSIEKSQFSKFVLPSNLLAPEDDDLAVIDIISPVLKKGRYQWKGIYNDEVVGFYMKDNEFKKKVLNKEIEFINGTAIKCILSKKREIGINGEIKISKFNVLKVKEVITNDKNIIFPVKIKKKSSSVKQLTLEFDSYENKYSNESSNIKNMN